MGSLPDSMAKKPTADTPDTAPQPQAPAEPSARPAPVQPAPAIRFPRFSVPIRPETPEPQEPAEAQAPEPAPQAQSAAEPEREAPSQAKMLAERLGIPEAALAEAGGDPDRLLGLVAMAVGKLISEQEQLLKPPAAPQSQQTPEPQPAQMQVPGPAMPDQLPLPPIPQPPSLPDNLAEDYTGVEKALKSAVSYAQQVGSTLATYIGGLARAVISVGQLAASLREQAEREAFENFLASLDGQYRELVGSAPTSLLDPASQEAQVRQAVWNAAQLLARGYRATGVDVPTGVVFKQALNMVLADKFKEVARKEAAEQMRRAARRSAIGGAAPQAAPATSTAGPVVPTPELKEAFRRMRESAAQTAG